MNRIQALFQQKKGNILSVFFTAGFPKKGDTPLIIKALTDAGVDMIEIGMPFSDPIADGPTIQMSNQQALNNGMSLDLLFEQLADIREHTNVPLILMGYLNPVMQYGMARFIEKAASLGIDGLILPDLPMAEYESEVQSLLQQAGMSNVFLVTPQTSEARIRKIDDLSDSFIYLVSSDSTTGSTGALSEVQVAYFERIKDMGLQNPTVIGFGIHDHATFEAACAHASGAIVGSACIKTLQQAPENQLEASLHHFVSSLRGAPVIR